MKQPHSIKLVALAVAIAVGFTVQAGSHEELVQIATHAVKLTHCPV